MAITSNSLRLGYRWAIIDTLIYLPSSTWVINLDVELGKLMTSIAIAPAGRVENNIVESHIRFSPNRIFTKFAIVWSIYIPAGDGFSEGTSRF